MIIKLQDCQEFVAGDNTILREIIHAAKGNWDLHYSLAHATLKAGTVSYPHSLTSSEIYYIISGRGLMHIDDTQSTVGPGDTVYIKPNAKQFIENTGDEDLTFICIVEPAWRAEDETVF